METFDQQELATGSTVRPDGAHDDESERKPHLDAYWEGERRLTALHEAGHASMFWFFQQRHYLQGIHMAGDHDSDAFVRQSSITMPGIISYVFPTDPRKAEALATMRSMHSLAGPCAEGLFGTPDCIDDDLVWLQGPLDEVDESLLQIARSGQRSDMHQAARAAWELHGPNEQKIRQHLVNSAKLTESALKLAGMEEVIRGLAGELIPVAVAGCEMDGNTVWNLMAGAWGNQRTLPLKTLPWNRRFEALNSEPWWTK